jgi:hypothetical protein
MYTRENGILETPVVGASTDETQNLWVATHEALYLLRPGEEVFHRFSAEQGLHLQSNPVAYCDANFAGGDRACPIYGGAVDPGIMEIAGGGPNEVFVGYRGHDPEGSGEWDDPYRHTGKLDRVRLRPDGTLEVGRIDFVLVAHGARYWHNRTVQRLVYDHVNHRHELYVGTNHGVDMIRSDSYRAPRPGEWFDLANREYMADHLHPVVCYHAPCALDESNQRMGDWRGLALSPDGEVWVAGRWTAGKIRWAPDILGWFMRPGRQAFSVAFGDPFPVPPNQYGFVNQPVFLPPEEGDPVSLSAVSVAPDGKVWFANSVFASTDVNYGVASWDGHRFEYFKPTEDIGMAESDVRDLIALPDGRIVLAGPNTGLVLWDSHARSHQQLQGERWLPDNHVLRMELDRMVSPPALYVSTYSGVSVIRQFASPTPDQ